MKYFAADNEDTESSLKVLKIVLKHGNNKSLQLIHQNSNPYKNAIAESIKGIIKKEFMTDK